MYCSKCGSEISPTTAFCSTCGQAISGLVQAMPSLSPVDPNQYGQVVPPSYGNVQYGGVAYAGFWLRFVAYIIDGVICGFAFLILLVPLFLLTGAGTALSKITSGENISDDAATFLGLGFLFGFFWNYISHWMVVFRAIGKLVLASHAREKNAQPESYRPERAADFFWPGFGTILFKDHHRPDSSYDRLHPRGLHREKAGYSRHDCELPGSAKRLA